MFLLLAYIRIVDITCLGSWRVPCGVGSLIWSGAWRLESCAVVVYIKFAGRYVAELLEDARVGMGHGFAEWVVGLAWHGEGNM